MKNIIDKEVNTFIKKLYDINQILKNIYKDEPNFSPNYLLTKNKAIYFDEECIPEYIEYVFNEDFDEDFNVIINSKEFFNFFKEKDNKESIKKISINKDSINFLDKNNSIVFKCINNKDQQIKIKNCIKRYKNSYNDLIVENIIIPEFLIEDIYKNNKLFNCIIDIDNGIVVERSKYKPKKDSSYIPIYLNKKFLNGISYKIKKLKKGDVSEYTPISLNIYETNGDSYYEVTIFVKLKNNDVLEHHFMICDF